MRFTSFVFALFAFAAPVFADMCQPEQVSLRGIWGQADFTVEIAEEAEERARGLMFRSEMDADAGMLFVYPAPLPAIAFWMKNTLIPLDIIFVDSAGQVAQIHENTVPLDLTPLHGGQGVQYVLEINGGLSAQLGLKPGDQLRHPSIDQNIALWPC